MSTDSKHRGRQTKLKQVFLSLDCNTGNLGSIPIGISRQTGRQKKYANANEQGLGSYVFKRESKGKYE